MRRKRKLKRIRSEKERGMGVVKVEDVCHQHSFVVWTTHSLLAASPTYHLTGSLVEDDDAQMMKVSLGCSEMGLSSHLQASKTGNTRFFTSNTHSSVVLQGFDQLRIEGLLCDVTLVAGDGDEAFPVHRAMMASSSDYFKAMFTATVECYNPRTNEWTYVAKMNEPHYGHAGTVYGGYMYISGLQLKSCFMEMSPTFTENDKQRERKRERERERDGWLDRVARGGDSDDMNQRSVFLCDNEH
ncbi:Kelch-like protein 13 [Anabarilius grahami]|uniref:Kelch-like protein 13 n=1 Tax=Anabarilius grahami TaxID=495550 RepID=A0A3N0Y3A4_ANAGA|nr:Kelch-like protein 13 [Anabarilius grahami]